MALISLFMILASTIIAVSIYISRSFRRFMGVLDDEIAVVTEAIEMGTQISPSRDPVSQFGMGWNC